MTSRWRRSVAGSVLLLAALAHADKDYSPYVIYETKAKYADVLDELTQAIINRGLVIGTTSHVQDMLDRTAKDLGGKGRIYENGDVLQFCSAVLISLFGWFVALRGLTLMAFPSAIQTGADATTTSSGLLIAARIFFGLLTVMGLWLSFVGWRPPKPVDEISAPARDSVSVRHGGNSRG